MSGKTPKGSNPIVAPAHAKSAPKLPTKAIDSGFIISADESGSTTPKNEGQTQRKKHKLFSDLRNIHASYDSSKVIGTHVFCFI